MRRVEDLEFGPFWSIAVATIGLLLTVNGFFIVKLVEKLEVTEKSVVDLRERVSMLEVKVGDLKEFIERRMSLKGATNGSKRNGNKFRAESINQANRGHRSPSIKRIGGDVDF